MGKFVKNPLVEEMLVRDTTMATCLMAKAQAAVPIAKGIAPVESGDYQRGIQADAGIEAYGAVGRLNATDWKSHWMEFGTSTNPAYAVLRRAVESIGLVFIKAKE